MEHMDAAVPIFQRRVGPLGLDVPPAGEAEFDHLVEEYRAQLGAGQGPVHINCMIGMAECRAAILAARELGYGPLWVSWSCNEEGESATRVHMLAALFVAEGMGAAAFGLNCPKELALEQLGVPGSACTIYEDSPGACEAAKTAGLTVVGVYDRFYAAHEEKMRRLCDCYVYSFTELLA